MTPINNQSLGRGVTLAPLSYDPGFRVSEAPPEVLPLFIRYTNSLKLLHSAYAARKTTP